MKKAIVILCVGFLLSISFAHSYNNCDSLSDAIAMYSFDNDCYSDATGNYDLIGNTASNIGGAFGNACYFDGNDRGYNDDIISAMSFSDITCLSFWFNNSDAADQGNTLITFENTGIERLYAGATVQNSAADKIQVGDSYDGSSQNYFSYTGYDDVLYARYHIAYCVNGQGHVVLFYAKNVDQGTDSTPSVTVPTLDSMTIGGVQYYNSFADAILDEIWVFNCMINSSMINDLFQGVDYPSFASPIISNLNCTSVGPEGDSSDPFETFDTTPTFSLTTDISSYCRISDKDLEYNAMGSERDCTDFESEKSHTCTLNSEDELSEPNDNVYIACGNKFNTSLESSVTLNITLTMLEINASTRIQVGIDNSVIGSGAAIYNDQQIYLRGLLYSPILRTVDKVAVFGNQRWLFNYNENNQTMGLYNITPVVYSLELINTPLGQIDEVVTEYIDSTKN